MALTDKLTAIGNAIREKTGKTELIPLSEMPNEIINIPVGDEAQYQKGYTDGVEAGKQAEYDNFWDNFQNYGNRTDYKYAFTYGGWNENNLKPKYMMKPKYGNGAYMFQLFRFGATERFDMDYLCKNKLDTSLITNATGMFMNAFVENVTLDLSNATTIQDLFNANQGGQYSITTATLKVSNKCTNFSNAFAYCGQTSKLIFTEDSEIVANLDIGRCLLTKESVISVFNALSLNTTDKTLSISKTAKNKFTDEEWAELIATKPNWTIAI